jgi:hypothetical protein
VSYNVPRVVALVNATNLAVFAVAPAVIGAAASGRPPGLTPGCQVDAAWLF